MFVTAVFQPGPSARVVDLDLGLVCPTSQVFAEGSVPLGDLDMMFAPHFSAID